MHVVGVTWRARNDGFDSGLTVRNESNELELLKLKRDMRIAWSLKGPKMCIGRIFTDRQLVPCPLNRLVVKGTKCHECSALDSFEPCIRCTGHQCGADEIRRDACRESDYIVYLAVFSDRSLKVGVSSKSRVMTRWVEQGADFAGVLSELKDGKMARRLEHVIGKHPAVLTAVSGYRKKNSLLDSLTMEDASSIVEEFLSKLPDDSRFQDVDLKNLLPYYGLENLDTEPLSWPEGNRGVAGQELSGEVVGMKGVLLVTHIGHAYRLVSLKRLIGYNLEEEISTTVNSQSGLLDFL
ncbi:MAG: DUF2797 domain-containing protein [Candidatus Thorarchaeota archaeon]|nr:DUF2797 domain-containing protein [Candidatus Thorarchaeota archaeon]